MESLKRCLDEMMLEESMDSLVSAIDRVFVTPKKKLKKVEILVECYICTSEIEESLTIKCTECMEDICIDCERSICESCNACSDCCKKDECYICVEIICDVKYESCICEICYNKMCEDCMAYGYGDVCKECVEDAGYFDY